MAERRFLVASAQVCLPARCQCDCGGLRRGCEHGSLGRCPRRSPLSTRTQQHTLSSSSSSSGSTFQNNRQPSKTTTADDDDRNRNDHDENTTLSLKFFLEIFQNVRDDNDIDANSSQVCSFKSLQDKG